MDATTAFFLGVIEGLTEFLPVSSTGHLILAGRFLHGVQEGSGAFDIVIQLGAIFAIVAHYRTLLTARLLGLLSREAQAVRLWTCLAISFTPAAVVGLLFRKLIKAHLFGPWPVVVALFVGGLVMLGVERWARGRAQREGLDQVTLGDAFAIGLGQCFALWPGASRSMSTIVAGQLRGLSTPTAAEYTFLLGIPTLGAAAVYEGYKSWAELQSGVGGLALIIGLLTSFVVSWAVIAGFVRYLGRRGLAPFAVYRMALALVMVAILSSER